LSGRRIVRDWRLMGEVRESVRLTCEVLRTAAEEGSAKGEAPDL
jgi:hypothetical protein